MSTEPDWIRDAVSLPRFAPYLARSSHHLPDAVGLYWWNVAVSAAFYAPLHCLEVALRNAAHRQLTSRLGRADWWRTARLADAGLRMVADAERKLAERGRGRSPDDMVAALSFGFWVSLFSGRYDRDLWVPGLHRTFPHYRGARRPLHRELHTMLLFRNRIMHHEPIHRRHLAKDHETLLRLLGLLSPALLTQLAGYDRVPDVLRGRPRPGSDR